MVLFFYTMTYLDSRQYKNLCQSPFTCTPTFQISVLRIFLGIRVNIGHTTALNHVIMSDVLLLVEFQMDDAKAVAKRNKHLEETLEWCLRYLPFAQYLQCTNNICEVR